MELTTLKYFFLLGGIVFLSAFLFYRFYELLPAREVKISSVNSIGEHDNGIVIRMIVVIFEFDSDIYKKVIKCIGLDKSAVNDKSKMICSLLKPNSFVKYHYFPMFTHVGVIKIPVNYPEMRFSLLLSIISLVAGFTIV